LDHFGWSVQRRIFYGIHVMNLCMAWICLRDFQILPSKVYKKLIKAQSSDASGGGSENTKFAPLRLLVVRFSAGE
jgi:hypothetical protein